MISYVIIYIVCAEDNKCNTSELIHNMTHSKFYEFPNTDINIA